MTRSSEPLQSWKIDTPPRIGKYGKDDAEDILAQIPGRGGVSVGEDSSTDEEV